MKRLQSLLCLAVVGLLCSCATPNVARDYTIPAANPKGVVLGSLTRSKSAKGHQGFSASVSGIRVFYRKLGSSDRKVLGLDSWMLGSLYQGDFEDIDGRILVIELEPGDYEFFSWSASQGTYTHVSAARDFSIPFKVTANEAKYIGELNLDVIFGKNFVGIGIVAGAEFLVKDSFERDMAVIGEKYPRINLSDVTRAVLNTGGVQGEPINKETTIPPPVP